MPRQITEKTFFQYIKCPTWVYFDVHAEEDKPHHPLFAKMLQDGMIDVEERKLIEDREDLVEVTAEDAEDGFRQTVEFMRDGHQTIFRPVLIDKHWVGTPEVLEKIEGKSNFGDYYYIAADIKKTTEVRDDYKFQGCFYAELLQRIQGVRPYQGYVICSDAKTRTYLIDEFEGDYKLTLDAIERIVAGEKPVHFMTSGCKQSPWFKDCRGVTESCRDLSMLNRVWREEVKRIEAAGYKTIDDLAAIPFPTLLSQVPDVDEHRLERVLQQSVAIRDNIHFIVGRADFPEAKIELFFDIESDPLRDFDYLFGVLEVSEGKDQYHLFAAETKENGKGMWEKFVSFIEQNIDAPIYHYGNFEQDVVWRFAAKYGISEIAREALERNMIDLLPLVRNAVVFPLSFYSLKDIAQYIGFKWRADDATGANSVLWFEEWLKTRDQDLFQKIVDYNEDDVRATWKLQRWLRENASL